MKNGHKVLLSCDFDFFFPIPEHDPECLYDWGMREDMSLFFGAIWVIRAAAFRERGVALPGTSGDEFSFWDRFTFDKKAVLYWAESHSLMYHREVSRGVGTVLNYDAHHDCYDNTASKKDEVDCGNWGRALINEGIQYGHIKPAWQFYDTSQPSPPIAQAVDNGSDVKVPIDRVFVCRSGAWVPGWLDDEFDKFIEKCPVKHKIQIAPLYPRKWDDAEVEKYQHDVVDAIRKGGIE